MKILLSQPMTGRTPDEIMRVREAVRRAAEERWGKEAHLIDSWIVNRQTQRSPLYLLGESVRLLSEADIAVFADGWRESRGCRIEHMCCLEYGIRICYMRPEICP